VNMQSLTYSNLPDGQRDSIDELRKDFVYDAYRKRLDAALRVSRHLSDTQLDLLQSCFDNRFVTIDTNIPLRDSAHPVLASLNDFANDEISRLIDHYNQLGYITMTIRDLYIPNTSANHNCLLIDSNRDALRLIDDTLSRPSNDAFARAIRAGRKVLCSDGAQCCHFQAKIACAVHSMYDVSMEDVMEIFLAHGLEKMIVYMYIPMEFYEPALKRLDEKFFTLRHDKEDNTILFNMCDFNLLTDITLRNGVTGQQSPA